MIISRDSVFSTRIAMCRVNEKGWEKAGGVSTLLKHSMVDHGWSDFPLTALESAIKMLQQRGYQDAESTTTRPLSGTGFYCQRQSQERRRTRQSEEMPPHQRKAEGSNPTSRRSVGLIAETRQGPAQSCICRDAKFGIVLCLESQTSALLSTYETKTHASS